MSNNALLLVVLGFGFLVLMALFLSAQQAAWSDTSDSDVQALFHGLTDIVITTGHPEYGTEVTIVSADGTEVTVINQPDPITGLQRARDALGLDA